MFSGGNDSTVLAHRCRDHYDGLAFIDTGTAVPGVAEFVGEYAHWIDKSLRVMHAGDAYRRMVLGGDPLQNGTLRVGLGFPGPAMHGRGYIMLKERQLATLLRESKGWTLAPCPCRVPLRRPSCRESAPCEARAYVTRTPLVGSVRNPLLNWSSSDMAVYRQAHRIPESDAAALLHRSGECNCGAFASAEHERAMLKALYPDFFASIEALEAEAEAAGLRWCRWGGYDRAGNRATQAAKPAPGPLCEACDARQSATVEAS